MLGRVIEKVSGQDYQEYTKRLLWKSQIYSMKLGHTRKKDNDISEVCYDNQDSGDSPLSAIAVAASCCPCHRLLSQYWLKRELMSKGAGGVQGPWHTF